MEDRMYKKLTGVIIVALIFAVAVYGSFLPLRKGQAFIGTLQKIQTTPPSSLQDLESRLSDPLNYPSPIGQEELVRNVANSVLAFIQQSPDATSTAQLIGFLRSYYDPIITRGKGMSFGQDIYLEGAINEIAFVETKDPTYLRDSIMSYQEASVLGPNRPQALYGLFDDYRAANDATNTLAVASKILANWPSDSQRINQSLSEFLNSLQSKSKTLQTPTVSGK